MSNAESRDPQAPSTPRSPFVAAVITALGTRALQQAALFVAATVAVGAVVTWLVLAALGTHLSRQVVASLSAEADSLAAVGAVSGAAALVDVVAARVASASGPDAGRRYLVQTQTGTRMAGDLAGWPSELRFPVDGVPTSAGGTFALATDRRAAGVVRKLPGGPALIVAQDLSAQTRVVAEVRRLLLAGFGVLALLGLAAGFLTARSALGRLADITRTSSEIMAGDLTRRVPLAGRGDELDELAANLNAMLDRIESLMAGLREVSDNIAHDLKTPLTRLRARAEAALRGGEAGRREGLGQVIEDADELIKTFNALLLIARLEAGALDASAEVFDLAGLARDMAELYEPVAEEAGLVLACEAGSEALVRVNRQLGGQAIANLLDNAIKYARPSAAVSGSPDVRISVTARGSDVVLAVGDRGPGIPSADRERVLKRFVRLDQSRTRPGTGLGLSLVAAVARLHGGRLHLEDNAPGLKVVLTLPRHRG